MLKSLYWRIKIKKKINCTKWTLTPHCKIIWDQFFIYSSIILIKLIFYIKKKLTVQSDPTIEIIIGK